VSQEKRREPRRPTQVGARLNDLELSTSNVSVHGVQLACPQMRFIAIEEGVRAGTLRAILLVPDGPPVSAELRVAYFCPAKDEMLIGAELRIAERSARERWEAFVGDLASSGKA
jgi:hypothetical protein